MRSYWYVAVVSTISRICRYRYIAKKKINIAYAAEEEERVEKKIVPFDAEVMISCIHNI